MTGPRLSAAGQPFAPSDNGKRISGTGIPRRARMRYLNANEVELATGFAAQRLRLRAATTRTIARAARAIRHSWMRFREAGA